MTDSPASRSRTSSITATFVGDTGSTDLDLAVTPRDLALTRRAVGMPTTPHLPMDHNRDGRVNVIDVALTCRNMGRCQPRPPLRPAGTRISVGRARSAVVSATAPSSGKSGGNSRGRFTSAR